MELLGGGEYLGYAEQFQGQFGSGKILRERAQARTPRGGARGGARSPRGGRIVDPVANLQGLYDKAVGSNGQKVLDVSKLTEQGTGARVINAPQRASLTRLAIAEEPLVVSNNPQGFDIAMGLLGRNNLQGRWAGMHGAASLKRQARSPSRQGRAKATKAVRGAFPTLGKAGAGALLECSQ